MNALNGKVALIAGGSRGIGAAIVRLAGANGYAAAVNHAKDKKSAEAVAAEIERAGGSGERVHYAASKGAIDTLTVGLAREVAAKGIRVTRWRRG